MLFAGSEHQLRVTDPSAAALLVPSFTSYFRSPLPALSLSLSLVCALVFLSRCSAYCAALAQACVSLRVKRAVSGFNTRNTRKRDEYKMYKNVKIDEL